MGTKMAPGYANVFMGKFEDDFVYTHPTPSLTLWKRYIDDCFAIWTGPLAQLEVFINYLNSCDPNIKFTFEASQTSVNFLDTTVNIKNGKLHTDLYCKPTDSHNYLLYTSAHPKRCKDSIPHSQFRRIRRICSDINDFDKHIKITTNHFLNRGYPIDLLQEAAFKARRLDRDNLLSQQTTKPSNDKDERTIFTTTFHPSDRSVIDIVYKNWSILGKSHTTNTLYERTPMVAYRRPDNISNLLVRADCRLKERSTKNPFLYTDLDTPRSSTKQTSILDYIPRTKPTQSLSYTNIPTAAGPPIQRSPSLTSVRKQNNNCTKFKCSICPILNKNRQLVCTTTGQSVPCKENITCKSSNLIYCITCQTCQKQYVGQTKNSITQRFYSHFHNIRHHKQTDAVGLHFSRSDHKGTKDVRINVLEFIKLPPHYSKALELRLKIEKYWIHKLRCPAPRGLNIFD